MFAQAALNWLTGGSPKPRRLFTEEEAIDLAEKLSKPLVDQLKAERTKLFSANLALAKDNREKDRTIYELREELYENTVDMAELTAELRIMKAARARSNANLILGGPKALEKRRRDAATKAMTAVRKAMEVVA